MTCKLPVRDLDSGETVLITRQTRQVSDKRACTDCEPKREGGKKTVESHCCSGNGKRELAEKKRNKTKEKEEKKRKKKKKKTLHVIVRVCCVTAALYFVNEECVRTNLQPLLMAKWLVTDR